MKPDSDPAKPQPPSPRVNGWALALDRAPLFLSVLLLFILPLITQLDSANSIAIKGVLARVIVFLMLAAWVLRAQLGGRLTYVLTPAFVPLALLGFWTLVTLFFSPYAPVGWRALADAIYLPLWFLLLTQTCLEVWRAENLILTFLAAAGATALWALGQDLGLDAGPWGAIVKNEFQGRVTAGLGNPDYLAGFLLTAWPLALALFFRASSGLAKALWGALLLDLWAALVLTQSQAGWLGWLVGLGVFAFFFFRKNPEAAATKRWWAGLAVLLVLLTLATPLRGRLATWTHNGSLQFRAQVWKGAWKLSAAHPVKGTGFGTFEAAFPPYRPEALMLRQQERSYEVDHAHNWVLEWAAEEGWVGAALVLLVLAGFLAPWWKLYQARAVPPALGAGAFAAFAGCAVDNLFDVNSTLPSTLVPLFFLAALPVPLSQRFFRMPGFPVQAKALVLPGRRRRWLPATLALLALSGLGLQAAFQDQLADKLLWKAEGLSRAGKWDDAVDLYGRVLKVDPDKREALYFRGASFLNRNAPGDTQRALADLEAVQALAPDYALVHFKKAQAYQAMRRLAQARDEMIQAVRLDPLLVFQDPDFARARKMVARKEFRRALPLYQTLLFDYPACVPLLLDTANTMVECGKTAPALDLYQRVLAYDPGNPDALSNIAAVKSLKH